MRSMGWVHCGMIVALYYGSILQVIEGDSVLPQAVWRGMLVVVPLAAADFAGELCRKLWQFALVSLAACGLAWALLGYPLADVEGFMENNGENFLCSGYWKVYANAEEAKRTFQLYDKARRGLAELTGQGLEVSEAVREWKNCCWQETIQAAG